MSGHDDHTIYPPGYPHGGKAGMSTAEFKESLNIESVADLRPVFGPLITTLPIDSNERKNHPLFRGCLRYFPAALAGVAKTSKLGNDKHNPGEDLHHARGKSIDHGDCILRHLVDIEDLLVAFNDVDSKVTKEDVLNEVNQMAWRALAFSQEMHEKFGSPLAPGAKK